MIIFSDNPVLWRELRSRLRLRKIWGSRPLLVLTGLILLIILWFSIKGIIGILNDQPQDARDLWSFLVLFLLLLTVLLAPALLSTAVTQEREQQTWETLALTRLSAGQVLLGKWLGRLSLTLLPAVILLPFLIACLVRGALAPGLFILALLFVMVTATGYGTLGLLCSYLARKSVNATVTAMMLTLAVCIGTPMIAALTHGVLQDASANYSAQDPVILWLNPFFSIAAVVSIFETQPVGMLSLNNADDAFAITLSYFVVTILATVAALSFMIVRYNRATIE